MAKTNKEIVLEFFEQVINQKRLDLYETYVSPDSIGLNPPYVGIGIFLDSHVQPGKVLIKAVAPGGPADGVLQAGDEILRISDGNKTLDSYEELKTSDVTPGLIGTTVNYLVRREGQERNFELKRGIIPGFNLPWNKGDMERLIENICPDICFETKMMVEEGDLVAYYGVNSATWKETGASVIFGECGMIRVKEGKIVEWLAITDDVALMKQQGYRWQAPEKKAVP